MVIASLTLASGMHGRPAAGAPVRGHRRPLARRCRPTTLALAGAAGHASSMRSSGPPRPGRSLATVTAPRPYSAFTFVSGADDDRTFVLAAQRWWRIASGTRGLAAEQRDGTTPAVFFRLRFDPPPARPG